MVLARSVVRSAVAAAVALTLAASPARAQETSAHLTMASMTRYFNGLKELALLTVAHPELGDSISIDGDSTGAQAAAMLARRPLIVAALARAGMTPREYVETTAAYLAASMALGMEKSVPGYKIPASTDAANVAFVRAHEADLAAMQKRAEAEIRKAVPQDASSD